MLINSSDLKEGSVIETEICIIGSGAAGLSIASEFKGTNRSIAILESGAPDFQKEVQALNKVTCTGRNVKATSRFRQFGGSTTAWSGKWLPLNQYDFKAKPWIAYSGWPIEYSDMTRYYQRAADMHQGPNIKSYFDEWPHDASASQKTDAELLPVSVYWLDVYNLDFSLTVGSFIEHDEHIDLYFSLTAVNISLNQDHDRVTYIEAITKNQRKIRIKASQFIVATGGIENARLLLASNTQMQEGIGNHNDNVGRFFMDHPKGNVARVDLHGSGSFPTCMGIEGKGNGTHRRDIGIRLREDLVASNKSVNSYMVWRPQTEHPPSASLRQLFSNLLLLRRSPTNWKIYVDILKSLIKLEKINFFLVISHRILVKLGLRSKAPKKFNLNYHIEQSPSPENRVTLSNELDMNGQPLAALHWTVSDIEATSVEQLHDEVISLLKQKECGKLIWKDGTRPDFKNIPLGDSSHHMGTTRMGHDEATSVVDNNCKVYGTQNLFIAGSSVFPTSGYANPTFTLVALAIRLADHLKELGFETSKSK